VPAPGIGHGGALAIVAPSDMGKSALLETSVRSAAAAAAGAAAATTPPPARTLAATISLVVPCREAVCRPFLDQGRKPFADMLGKLYNLWATREGPPPGVERCAIGPRTVSMTATRGD
jgi:hypothetical protein